MAAMKKVLVLEDEASIRGFIVINLRRAGYDVIESESGEDAMERLRENPDIRVALLDIMLPGIDGYQVCREVCAKCNVPIIMLSAKGEIFDKKISANGLFAAIGRYSHMLSFNYPKFTLPAPCQ